jgi:hypothetical protein
MWAGQFFHAFSSSYLAGRGAPNILGPVLFGVRCELPGVRQVR